ncbi:MAG: homocysteine S-methyltransferase family protein [Bacteroidales bacterium]|nr:homocysteine S-methyltransferase family protein [Bacteroidales bacterium]MCF8338064.1 homocysteine S-methyltransferase family protein [Bacteroidales bacterium]
MSLNEIIKDRILILDGPMTPMIRECDLEVADSGGEYFNKESLSKLSDNHAFLSLTHPELIQRIHGQYLEAGADIIKTNTLNANALFLEGHNREEVTYNINRQSALIAREMAHKYSIQNKPRFVAGVLGITGNISIRTEESKISASRDLNFETLVRIYQQQAWVLNDGEVDMFLIETIIDSLNVKAVLTAIEKINYRQLPVTISVTPVDSRGHTITGQKFESFMNAIAQQRIFSVGINCSFRVKSLLPLIRRLSARTPFYVTTHFSAGFMNGNAHYNHALNRMDGDIESFFNEGLVNIAGGCYDSRPAHIKTIAGKAKKYNPRKRPANPMQPKNKSLKDMNTNTANTHLKQGEKETSQPKSSTAHVSLEEARQNAFIPGRVDEIRSTEMLGVKVFDDYSLEELRDYIDWTPFFLGWGMKGKYPGILEDEKKGKEANRIFREANQLLDKIIENKLISAKGVFGLFPANAKGDDILVFEDDNREKVRKVIPMLRQQRAKRIKNEYLSLSDYLAPFDSGLHDYIGAFAVSAGIDSDYYVNEFKQQGDHYNSIMFRLVCDRLTEAFAELLHERVRKEFWGYHKDENLCNESLVKEKFQGIRPAPGYPACPDHTLKGDIFELLEATRHTDIKLTSSYAMHPASSVSGFYVAHPEARYFRVGSILEDQLQDYARRRGWKISEAEKWLAPLIGYQTGVKV